MTCVTLLIVGAGGVGREALDVALALGRTVDAFLDDGLADGERRVRDLPVLRPDEAEAGAEFVIGIADPVARERLAALLVTNGLVATTLVHPRAVVGPETTLGAGSLVMAGAHVSSSCTFDTHVQVHYNATVGHRLDERVSVFPGANVGGTVHLGAGATVGSGAIVLQGLTVGAGAMVGAGAVVTRDVAPGTTVKGVPAR
jgi:sugar O-acyltransferase (sialic acid O-acetyltransferase NeuD family)